MVGRNVRRCVASALLLGALAAAHADAPEKNWPQFRGPGASGVAEGFKTPVTWNIERGENLRWKQAIPGLGHSSPAIWGERIFLTTAVAEGKDEGLRTGLYGDIESVNENYPHKFQVICIDKKDGKILWTQTAHEGVPKVKRHQKGSHASCTVATDGKHVVAFFGSEGLYCYDFDGKLLWKRDFGVIDSGYYVVPSAQWGFSSSPVIFENRVIIQADGQKDSFVAALNIADGHDVWKTARDEVPTWGSPTVYRQDGRTQVICNGYKHIGGYDFATGKEVWKLVGGGDIPIPTPIVAHGLIFIANAHGRMGPLYAIRSSAEGTIVPPDPGSENQNIVWWNDRAHDYMHTPIIVGDELYTCRTEGVMTAFDARTGAKLYGKRLGKGSASFTASSVAADGKIYFTDEDGDVFVVKAGKEFELLATNEMGEVCMATPAISEGVLYFRTQKSLIAIGARP